uniref:Uncharacterized protein n=1 Tax=Anguilla anguilla TaxID=7936 RepID=A0A0E9SG99_ANGAN
MCFSYQEDSGPDLCLLCLRKGRLNICSVTKPIYLLLRWAQDMVLSSIDLFAQELDINI